MALRSIGNSDDAVATAVIDFLSKSKEDALFHRTTFHYSHADWNDLHDCLRDVLWEDIFKLGASAAAFNFLTGSSLELRYISTI